MHIIINLEVNYSKILRNFLTEIYPFFQQLNAMIKPDESYYVH